MAGHLLHTRTDGTDDPGQGRRLVLVHGFTQTGDCWGSVGTNLGRDHKVIRVDAPGHGRSDHADADLSTGARLLGDTCGTADYLGYSMGGRLCLHLALARPDMVRRVVLIGATPGLRSPQARGERRAGDENLAARLEEVGVETFMHEWLALPLFSGLDHDGACLEARLTNTAAGLATSLRNAGTGTQEPLWDRLGELEMPVLCVAGADDEKFLPIAGEMAAAIGTNATVRAIVGVGHSAHLEDPDQFLTVLRRWEDSLA